MRTYRRITGVLTALIILWLATGSAPAGDAPKRPKLAVLLVFDQLRGDYLQKWEPLFDGGFKRLQQEGAWFTNCHYPYAYTLTAPGHASMSTGCSPNKHGIVGNDWYDRANRETVESITPPPEEKRKGRGPYRRRSESVGDVLLQALGAKGRVASFSIKDRAAILLAALRAQMCYWFNSGSGSFVTSPYYREEPHRWVTAFNKGQPALRWAGDEWRPLRTDLDYAKFSGPDDVKYEGIGFLQGRTFPHPFLPPIAAALRPVYFDAVTNSPQGNELLLEFAKTAIDAEKLGQGVTTDLLCLSFSSNDLVGHCWGPDSQEVLDMTLRTDHIIRDLLQHLDTRVGKGNYVVVLCADHGVCPLPELAAAEGKDAGRIAPELLTSRAEDALNEKFLQPAEKAPWLEAPKKGNMWVYLNDATLKEFKVARPVVEKTLADWLAKQPGVEAAFTRTEMMSLKKLSPLGEAMRRSFHPDGSGDVMVVPRPYHLFSSPVTVTSAKNATYRTTHGTPHPYDTHVPLLVWGAGVQKGKRDELVTPQAVASILAEALGLPRLADAEVAAPKGLFEARR